MSLGDITKSTISNEPIWPTGQIEYNWVKECPKEPCWVLVRGGENIGGRFTPQNVFVIKIAENLDWAGNKLLVIQPDDKAWVAYNRSVEFAIIPNPTIKAPPAIREQKAPPEAKVDYTPRKGC